MINRNNKLRLKIYATLISVSFFSGCTLRRNRKIYIVSPSLTGQPSTKPLTNPHVKKVTVLIHGTSQTANALRFIPFLYNFLALRVRTPNGLHHYTELPRTHRFITCAEELHGNSPQEFPIENSYFFGWSGKLSPKERKRGAYALYAGLKTLLSNPEMRDAEITIITHSHGGNVALYLAEIVDENKDSALKIKRLVLTACPIQDETECYAHHPLFEKIYNLYSVADFLQVADPQGLRHQHIKHTKTILSRREIDGDRSSDHITQAAIRINGYCLNHIDFISPFFHKEVPFIITLLDDSSKKKLLPHIGDSSYQVNLLTRKSCRYYTVQRRIISFT